MNAQTEHERTAGAALPTVCATCGNALNMGCHCPICAEAAAVNQAINPERQLALEQIKLLERIAESLENISRRLDPGRALRSQPLVAPKSDGGG